MNTHTIAHTTWNCKYHGLRIVLEPEHLMKLVHLAHLILDIMIVEDYLYNLKAVNILSGP